MKLPHVIPVMSEKSYAGSTKGVYVFQVPLSLNKNEIKQAVEEQFNVTVTGIKTLVQSGKAIRFSKGKGRYPGVTNRKDTKKAYVTLKDGDSIKAFESVEAQEENK